MNRFLYFFFFKQKTAYEMLRSLVGSEMCIRDRYNSIDKRLDVGWLATEAGRSWKNHSPSLLELGHGCLLYTSDAADDLLCVDLGGRRIIKKKTNTQTISRVPTQHVHTIL